MSAPPIPDHIVGIERPIEALLNKAPATNVAFPVTMLLFYFRYHTIRYKFDAEGIRMNWGILVRHGIMLNYSRIQDIHLHSNLISAPELPAAVWISIRAKPSQRSTSA